MSALGPCSPNSDLSGSWWWAGVHLKPGAEGSGDGPAPLVSAASPQMHPFSSCSTVLLLSTVKEFEKEMEPRGPPQAPVFCETVK